MELIKDRFVGPFIGGQIGHLLGNELGYGDPIKNCFLLPTVVKNLVQRHCVDGEDFINAPSNGFMEGVDELAKLVKSTTAQTTPGHPESLFSAALTSPLKGILIGIFTSTEHFDTLKSTMIDYVEVAESNMELSAAAVFGAVAGREVFLYGVTIRRCYELTDKNGDDILKNVKGSLDQFATLLPQILDKYQIIKDLLNRPELSLDEIRKKLGNGSHCIETALFCFLMSFGHIPIPELQLVEDQFLKTVQLALSVGGDVAFIATAAGAFAGAFLGKSRIPNELVKELPELNQMIQNTGNLFAYFKSTELPPPVTESPDDGCGYMECNQEATQPSQFEPAAHHQGSLHFPTDCELAQLVSIQRYCETGDKCIHKAIGRCPKQKRNKIRFQCAYLYKRKWRKLEIRKPDKPDEDFKIAAYHNTLSNQLVIIPGGTTPTNERNFVRRFEIFTRDTIEQLVDEYAKHVESITLAGYGVDGSIIQATVADLEVSPPRKALQYPHFHCVCFESPNFITQKLFRFGNYQPPREGLESLDITSYLVQRSSKAQNQLGSVYLLRRGKKAKGDLKDIEGIAYFLLEYENGEMWDTPKLEILKFDRIVKKDFDHNNILKFSISVFDSNEQKYIRDVATKNEWRHLASGFKYLGMDFHLDDNGTTVNIEALTNKRQLVPIVKYKRRDEFIKGVKMEIPCLIKRSASTIAVAMASCECGNLTIDPMPPDPGLRSQSSPKLLFPSDTDLANMTNIAYSLNTEDSCLHTSYQMLSASEERRKLEVQTFFLISRGWKILATFEASGKVLHGYSGFAFYNDRHNQIVIVHRCTEKGHPWSVNFLVDIKSIESDVTEFVQTAYWFTNEVIRKYGATARSVTVTGHSLGGWLAQASAFVVKYPEYQSETILSALNSNQIQYKVKVEDIQECKYWKHLHCVCFDSPGFKEIMLGVLPKSGEVQGDRLNYDRQLDPLDVSVYLVEDPMEPNAAQNQIGSVFLMQGLKVHSSNAIVEFWLDYEREGFEGRVMTVTEFSDTLHRDILIFRTSVFDDTELDSFKTIQYIKDNLVNKADEWCKQFPGHEFLGKDFVFTDDFHTIDINGMYEGNRRAGDLLAFRDYFVESCEFHLNRFKKVHLEECIRANCQQYTSSLLQFKETTRFPHMKDVKKATQKVHILKVQPGKEDVAVGQILHTFKKDVQHDPKLFLLLDVTILSKLQKLLGNFYTQAVSLNRELVVIQGKGYLKVDEVDAVLEFTEELCKSALIKKVVLVLPMNSTISVTDLILDTRVLSQASISEKVVPEESTAVSFSTLSENVQTALKGRKIMFKGVQVTLGSMFSDFLSSGDVWGFFQSDSTSMGSAVPVLNEFEDSCFFGRRFSNIVLEPKYLTDFPDKVILSPCYRSLQKEILPAGVPFYVWGSKLEYKDERFIVIPESNSASFFEVKQFVEKHQLKAHWFRIDGNGKKLVWQESFSNCYSAGLKRFIQRKDSISFEEMLNKNSQLRIFADGPGRGKTIVMRKLATLALQDWVDKPEWVIFLDPWKCRLLLKMLTSTEITLDSVLEIIASIESGNFEIGLIKSLLGSLAQQDFRVKIFLDGFDEITCNLRESVKKLVKLLISETSVQIFISTRTSIKNDLEYYFGHFAFSMLELGKGEQVNVLSSFLLNHPESKKQGFNCSLAEDVVNSHIYATKLLAKFEKETAGDLCREIEVPLQLHLLAQIAITTDFFQFLKAAAKLPFEDLKVLADVCMKDLFERLVQEKLKVTNEGISCIGESENPYLKDSFLAELYKVHGKSAFEFLSWVEVFKECFKRWPVNLNEAIPELLIHRLELDQPPCIPDRSHIFHRTLAEYFGASFIVTEVIYQKRQSSPDKKRLNQIRQFLDNYLFKEQFKVMKHFVDKFILNNQSTPAIFKRINGLKNLEHDEELLSYLESDKVEVDCFDRTILHWAMERERLSDISWFVAKCKRMTSRRDWFNATPFAHLIVKEEFRSACLKLDYIIDHSDKLLTGKTERFVVLGFLLVDRWQIGRERDEPEKLKLLSKYPNVMAALDEMQNVLSPMSSEYSHSKSFEYYHHKYLKHLVHKEYRSLLAVQSLRNADEDILEFVETQADLLSDLNIVIRRNEGVPPLHTRRIFDNAEVEHLLQSVCSLNQREGLTVDLFRILSDVRNFDRQKHVESVVLEFLQKDHFKNYKQIIRSLEMNDYSREQILWDLIKPKGGVTYGSDLFNIFYETEFVSLQRIYNPHGHFWFIEDFVACFHSIPFKHDARTKILAICSEALARISKEKDLRHLDGTKALLTLKYYNDEARTKVLIKYHDLFYKIISKKLYSNFEGVQSILPVVTEFLKSDKVKEEGLVYIPGVNFMHENPCLVSVSFPSRSGLSTWGMNRLCPKVRKRHEKVSAIVEPCNRDFMD